MNLSFSGDEGLQFFKMKGDKKIVGIMGYVFKIMELHALND